MSSNDAKDAAQLLYNLADLVVSRQHLPRDTSEAVARAVKALADVLCTPGMGLSATTAGQPQPSALHHLTAKELSLSAWSLAHLPLSKAVGWGKADRAAALEHVFECANNLLQDACQQGDALKSHDVGNLIYAAGVTGANAQVIKPLVKTLSEGLSEGMMSKDKPNTQYLVTRWFSGMQVTLWYACAAFTLACGKAFWNIKSLVFSRSWGGLST